MTDNEIIKSLECHTGKNSKRCQVCPYEIYGYYCLEHLYPDLLDLINRQKAEIERLNTNIKTLENVIKNSFLKKSGFDIDIFAKIKSEAIKEFANEFIKTLKDALYGLDIKEKTISKEEVQKRFELLMHKDIPEVIEYVKNKMVGDEK